MDKITVISLCSTIVIIGGAISYVVKMISPYSKLKEKVSQDSSRLNTLEEDNKIIQKSIVALLDHEITGNSVDKLKQARTDLQNHLINK